MWLCAGAGGGIQVISARHAFPRVCRSSCTRVCTACSRLWNLSSLSATYLLIMTCRVPLSHCASYIEYYLIVLILLVIIIILIIMNCLWCCYHDSVIARVHPDYLMNIEQFQAAATLRSSQQIWAMSPVGPCRLMSCRTVPVCFLAGCHKRPLNQVLFSLGSSLFASVSSYL